MFASLPRGPRWGLPALLILAAGLTLASSAWADDFLDQVKRQNKVQAQKMDATVTQTLAEARTLEFTDPAKAVGVLRRAKSMLEEDRALSETRRAELLRLVEARLRNVQNDIAARAAKTQPPATTTATDPRSKYQSTINKQPPRVADQASDYIKTGRGQVSEAERLKRDRENGFNSVFNDIARSNIPISGEAAVTFPPNWREKMEFRKNFVGPKLTVQEKSLLKAMNSVLSVNFDKTTFRDVLDFLQEKTGQSIVVDKAALEESQVQYDDPITFSARKVTFRTVLRKILADRGLAYILKDGIIQVVTPQQARETLVTRSYPLGELMPAIRPGMPAFFSQVQAMQAVALIIQTIETTIEPESWAVNGGRGTISFNPVTMSLVIRNSAEMHYGMMSGMFGR